VHYCISEAGVINNINSCQSVAEFLAAVCHYHMNLYPQSTEFNSTATTIWGFAKCCEVVKGPSLLNKLGINDVRYKVYILHGSGSYMPTSHSGSGSLLQQNFLPVYQLFSLSIIPPLLHSYFINLFLTLYNLINSQCLKIKLYSVYLISSSFRFGQ